MRPTLLLVAGLLSVAGCKNSSVGTAVDADAARSLPFDKANDGKRFAITGYPSISGDIWTTTGRASTVSVSFLSEPGGEGDTVYSVEIPFGTGSDHVNVPDSFGPEDVTLYDHSGDALAYDRKAKVSFTLDLLTDKEPMDMPIFSKNAKGLPVTTPGKMYFHSHKDVRIDAAD